MPLTAYFDDTFFRHINEWYSMILIKQQMSEQAQSLKTALATDNEDLRFCYTILKDVSRSFAAVIIQLHEELRDAVCVFYLVLRGLDTVEDDMSLPISFKKDNLPTFHTHLNSNDWSMDGVGKDSEKLLLQQFYRVSREFMKLKPSYQSVITDICERMANGMCYFLDHEVSTKKDYDLYCHYVAGLVGIGLQRLFEQSGLEQRGLEKTELSLELANHMGLFLQKTNIIRDYLEDISEVPPRIFWPREIWHNYTDDIHSFSKGGANTTNAMLCLNAMIADALVHVPHVIEYLASHTDDPSIFLFCAIPQVMAMATLSLLYNNRSVFENKTSKVKIRKGLACLIMIQCKTFSSAMTQFHKHLMELEKKLKVEDPSYKITQTMCVQAKMALLRQMKKKVLPEAGTIMNEGGSERVISQHSAWVDVVVSIAFWFSLVSLPLLMTYDDNYMKWFDASLYDAAPHDYWNSKQWPSPLGLSLGIGAVIIGHVFLLCYFTGKLKGVLGSAPQLIQNGEPLKYELSEGLRTHLAQPEGFVLLGGYLTLTWMLGLMPSTYYSFSGGINLAHLAAQLIIQDFVQTLMHLLEHNTNRVSIQAYVRTHKPHHRFTNPRLFDAFNGSIGDTMIMILVPLYITALTVPANVWTYMAFGAIYASWLTLIHSEFHHPWDWLFRVVGLGTVADHHVHHKLYNYNYGHLTMWWDFLFRTYKDSALVASFQPHL